MSGHGLCVGDRNDCDRDSCRNWHKTQWLVRYIVFHALLALPRFRSLRCRQPLVPDISSGQYLRLRSELKEY